MIPQKKKKLGYSSPSSQSKKGGLSTVESVWPMRPEILVSVLGGLVDLELLILL